MPDEIVTVAPVKSVSVELTVTPESTATAVPPTVKVLVVPDGVTTGGAIDLDALGCRSCWSAGCRRATIDIARGVVLVLVVENVTDCKAA